MMEKNRLQAGYGKAERSKKSRPDTELAQQRDSRENQAHQGYGNEDSWGLKKQKSSLFGKTMGMYCNNISGFQNHEKAGGPGLEKGRQQGYSLSTQKQEAQWSLSKKNLTRMLLQQPEDTANTHHCCK